MDTSILDILSSTVVDRKGNAYLVVDNRDINDKEHVILWQEENDKAIAEPKERFDKNYSAPSNRRVSQATLPLKFLYKACVSQKLKSEEEKK